MKAFMKTAPGVGNMAVREIPTPEPGPGEVLVRVEQSGLCGTDILLHDGLYRGRRNPVPPSLIVGHEASGEVVALGPGTIGPKPGTRVAIEAVTGCGVCFQCLRGHYNLCQDWHHLGLSKDGVLAEFAALPASSLLPLPDEVTYEAAAFLEPLATAINTLERVRPLPDATAAIVGPGPLGFLHFQALQAAGLSPIVMIGRAGDERRLQLARALGAETILANDRAAALDATRGRTDGRGFDLVLEAAGSGQAIQTALDLVAGRGTLVSLGIFAPVEIDVLSVMRKDLTWVGVVASVRRHWAQAIRLLQQGKLHPERLITHRMPLAEAVTGIDTLRRREAVKVMFEPSRA